MANRYVKKRGSGWVVVNRTGRVLSRHRTKGLAERSFRAMEAKAHTDSKARATRRATNVKRRKAR